MNVSELVGRALAELGVGHAFGVVGSGNFEVVNALRAAGVPYTAARHEGGAAVMADAYARMSGRVSVVSTHQGCGLTNAVTGIAEAAKSRTPLIVLTADTAASARQSNFRIDQDALARSVGAIPERVASPATALADTARAFRIARNERRTVVLSLPLDVQAATAPDAARASARVPRPAAIRPGAADVAAFADLLLAAQRPVFVAGRGARGAGPELRRLAERVGALLAEGAVAKGLFAADPWNVGISGGFSTPAATELISAADLVVGWGSTLNMWTMGHGTLIGPEATVVQVDLEDGALGINRPIDLGILGDAARTAEDVLTELDARGEGARTGYRTPVAAAALEHRGDWRTIPFEPLGGGARIDPRTLTIGLDRILPAERTVSVDSGNFMGYPSQFLGVPDELGFCFTQAFQSVGLGLATAIGAATARPDRLAVAALGDGGFLMGISELETVVRAGLRMAVVVYDDHAYGAEVHHFPADADLGAVTFPEADLAAIARGHGFDAVTVSREADLSGVADWVAGPQDRPLFVHGRIASDGGSWWLAEAFRGH